MAHIYAICRFRSLSHIAELVYTWHAFYFGSIFFSSFIALFAHRSCSFHLILPVINNGIYNESSYIRLHVNKFNVWLDFFRCSTTLYLFFIRQCLHTLNVEQIHFWLTKRCSTYKTIEMPIARNAFIHALQKKCTVQSRAKNAEK